MNSIKILVNSLDNLYPSKSDYEIPPSNLEIDTQNDELDDTNNAINLTKKTNDINDNVKREKSSDESSNVLMKILNIIFFLPNYILIKPLIFIWLLTIYPIIHLFEKLDSSDNEILGSPSSNNNSDPSSIDIEVDKKTELLKQENIISNTIKSPTSSSKYIIPPPQRLYPLSRNPGKKRKRKTLILDLDETLIHSLSRGSPRSFNTSSSQSHMIEIKINNIATLYYVHKRPFCDYFLKEISKWFELQIFTASVKEYANPIIDWLESDIVDRKNPAQQRSKIFTRRYYRHDCTYRPGIGYIKDLSKFFPRDDDLKNVIILDNSPISYALHEENAVMIEGWINDQSDRDLLNLLPMLHSLSLCIDVRFILGLRSGEKVFER